MAYCLGVSTVLNKEHRLQSYDPTRNYRADLLPEIQSDTENLLKDSVDGMADARQ